MRGFCHFRRWKHGGAASGFLAVALFTKVELLELYQRTELNMQMTVSNASSLSASQSSGKGAYRVLLAFGFFAVCALITICFDKPPRPVSKIASLTVFSAERAAKHLSVIGRAPHPINSAEHDAVRDYILASLRALGLTPQVQKTTLLNESDHLPGALENIVCRLQGSSHEKAVLVVAHYDSVSAGPGASDDGAAVAAFLETARILKSLPQLRRNIIFLFTDGEEKGLLGARAFVAEHPWAHDISVVLNFEARGNSGPSIMFETSDKNGWLIKNFGQAASHPVANSLSYEIYKRLPNDTDFTIFRRAGYSGLNFAYIAGLEYYHTPSDSSQNTDLGSLQHHGDYLLELVKQFGNAASDDPRSDNMVYFDILGEALVHYGYATSILLLALTSILAAFALWIGFRKKSVRAGACFIGFLSMFAGVAVTAMGAVEASRIQAAIGGSRLRASFMYHNGWYILAFSLIGLACGVAFYLWMARWIGAANMAAGIILGWTTLAITISFYLPGGSYLLVWPLFFSIMGCLAAWLEWRVSTSLRNALVTLCNVPAIVLLVSMAHKTFFAFAGQSTLMVSVLLGLLLSLLFGELVKTTSARWFLPPLLATTGAALLIVAIALPKVI